MARRPSPKASLRGARAPRAPAPPAAARVPSLPEGLVPLGEIGRAHGLKGEVRIKSFTDDPVAIGAYGPLVLDDGTPAVLGAVRPLTGTADMVLARIDGVTTREAAEVLNRRRLLIPRDRLPPPDDEDEFLAADLVGLSVETPDGRTIGTVIGVPDFGGGDLLEIRPPRGPTAFLPFTKAFVPTIDLAARRLVVEAPDDLFEPAKPHGDERS
ncbi:ribosome maturation factor RimM [Salinarimonas soli]|uniref:Ribosome maturation factor RimM n=1 Tax=Salinarimonas soli TaxID=1638099 RepID=A0A5B2V848_9HYPH|nr:ribosome maturation factor RimM [Salinarimonas soli]KAA2234928.1 ribosome maturation factor RimM [Salinarimonas soli]